MSPRDKKICLVSDGQPSTNPRLVKEADALFEAGYNLTVIFCQGWAEWAAKSDGALLAARKWKYRCVRWSKKENSQLYHKSRWRFFVCRWLAKHGCLCFPAEYALCRVYPELLELVLSEKADLYIAHYLGALSAAACAAKKYGAKLGFDAEDFHSGEIDLKQRLPSESMLGLIESIERKHLRNCAYVTAASGPMAEAYAHKYHIPEPAAVLNVFPLDQQKSVNLKKKNEGLSLYWFSQTVGPNRGLEDVIRAMGFLKKDSRLYLQGQVSAGYQKELVSLSRVAGLNPDQIVFLEPVHPDILLQTCSQFDVGLALESPQTVNRDLCVTNKFFTYLLGGLSVIATNTKGQRSILRDIGKAGWLYEPGDIKNLASRLSFLASNPVELELSKQAAVRVALEKYNWDNEKKKFLSIVEKVMG